MKYLPHALRTVLSTIFAFSAALPLHSAFALSQGESAPKISLPSMEGKQIDLSRYSGKVVYLDFWASWCDSCKSSLPWMNTLQKKYGGNKFQVLTVNLDSNTNDAKTFLESMNHTFAVAVDPKGETPERFGVESMPTSFVIDQQGKVVATFKGFCDSEKENIESEIRKLVEG